MPRWTFAAIVLAAVALPAHAQDGVDWGGLMQTEAMGSAMEEAAREGTTQSAPPTRARADASAADTKANCARVRGWIAEGKRDPVLPQLVGLCKQLGY